MNSSSSLLSSFNFRPFPKMVTPAHPLSLSHYILLFSNTTLVSCRTLYFRFILESSNTLFDNNSLTSFPSLNLSCLHIVRQPNHHHRSLVSHPNTPHQWSSSCNKRILAPYSSFCSSYSISTLRLPFMFCFNLFPSLASQPYISWELRCKFLSFSLPSFLHLMLIIISIMMCNWCPINL